MKHFKFTLKAILFIFLSQNSMAQSTLSAGDIAFTGFHVDDNSNGNEEIKFLLLTDILSGTEIYFTDFGWLDSDVAFQSPIPCGANTGAVSDGTVKWTATSDMSCGEQIILEVKTVSALSATSGTIICQEATYNDANRCMNLSSAGEQIFAYQDHTSPPTFIAGCNTKNAWNGTLTSCEFTSTKSIEPSTLSSNNTSWVLDTHFDNGYYTGPIDCGDVANTRLEITDFANNWTLSNSAIVGGIPLPVEMTEFKASIANTGDLVNIYWEVASELNNRGFEVQKSLDGNDWVKIDWVSSNGDSDFATKYTSRDNSPNNGLNYYRLKQIDLDGQYAVTEITVVNYKIDASEKLNFYPNPVINAITLSDPIAKGGTLNIYSTDGSLILSKKIVNTTDVIDLSSIHSGVYIIELINEEKVKTSRFIKQ